HFVSTLETGDNWEVLVSDIRRLYDNIRPEKEEFHDNNLGADKQVIVNQLIEIGSPYLTTQEVDTSLKYINNIFEKNIKIFIQKVLSLAETFPQFFIDPNNYNKIQLDDKCLRTLDFIFSESILKYNPANTQIIVETLDNIFDSFVNEKTFLYQIINDITTTSAKAVIDKIRNEVDSRLDEIDLQLIRGNYKFFEENVDLLIPTVYFKLSVKELFNNMRHSDGRVKISFYSDDTYLYLVAINGINSADKKWLGNGNGFILLSNLRKNDVFNCDYIQFHRLGCFVQKLKFKRLNK
ncbi:MAG: hypothetical protein ACJASR_002362, partial [Psychroserpens sp.]